MMEYFTLRNGIKIPAVGSGTNSFGREKETADGEKIGAWTPVFTAIEAGYELFDTAIMYRNEEQLGQVLKKTGVKREKLFIIGKMPAPSEGEDVAAYTKACIEKSLNSFNTGYLDMYLMHKPWDNAEEMTVVWRTLLDYEKQGILKSVGVSNFTIEQMEILYKNTGVYPIANEIQINPSEWNKELTAYCQTHEILPIAWAPLTRVSEDYKELLSNIGLKYNKSWAQVLLRYDYQRGICVIPKSHNKINQIANLQIFDFEISADDMNVLGALVS